MATENPRVAGYVPKEVFDRLMDFRKEQDISVSQALTIILAEYFKVSYQSVQVVAHFDEFITREEFEALSAKVDALAKVSQNDELLSELPGRIALLERRLENTKTTKVAQDSGQLTALPLGGLAKRLGITSSTLSHWKGTNPRKSKSPSELLEVTRSKDPDGIGWIFDSSIGKFKPERDLPSSSPDSLQSELPFSDPV